MTVHEWHLILRSAHTFSRWPHNSELLESDRKLLPSISIAERRHNGNLIGFLSHMMHKPIIVNSNPHVLYLNFTYAVKSAACLQQSSSMYIVHSTATCHAFQPDALLGV